MAFPSFDLGLPTPTLPGIRPREWQTRLIQLLRARLLNGQPGGHDVLIHAGPGAGKTLGALLSFHTLQREARLERFLVFCHRSSIANQWHQAAERLGLRLLPWDPELGLGALPVAMAEDAPELVQCFDPPAEGLARTWLVIGPEANKRREVRAFADFLAPRYTERIGNR